MKNNLVHISLALVLIIVLTLLVDPFMLLMPPTIVMVVLLVAAVLLCIWAGFVIQEKSRDEREVLHKLHAGRLGYLAGFAVLTLGLLVEGLSTHHVNVWVALALVAMVAVKLAAHLYDAHHK